MFVYGLMYNKNLSRCFRLILIKISWLLLLVVNMKGLDYYSWLFKVVKSYISLKKQKLRSPMVFLTSFQINNEKNLKCLNLLTKGRFIYIQIIGVIFFLKIIGVS